MSSDGSQNPVICRDLAKRARRLAGTFLDGPDKRRLLRYADEMEQRAMELDKAPSSASNVIAPTPVTHSQQQVQQQQATGPTPKPKS